jgi:DNA polymerase zeta
MLNLAMCVKETAGTVGSNHHQHVYKIELISTKSMYGYHEADTTFLKIYLYNPDLIRKLSELLMNGTIMGESFHTFESHVPFNLQFLMDYNLFGMNLLHCDSFKFRRRRQIAPLTENQESDIKSTYVRTAYDETTTRRMSRHQDETTFKWNPDELAPNLLLNENFERQSTCELELDIDAANIRNVRMDDNDSFMLNPGMSSLWEEEKQRRAAFSIDKPLEVADLDERTDVRTADNELEFRKRLISLLETRFGEKHPFKIEKRKTNNASVNSAADSLDDEDILNILNDLHNMSGQEAELNNSLLHATQLNEEDKEILINENNELIVVEENDKK